MKIALSAETTIDLTKELLKKFNLTTIPFTILLGDEQLTDGENVSKKIFEYVDEKKVLPKTTAINQFEYEEHFAKLLKENDYVIHICLSSMISCACANAQKASEKFDGKVKIIDSLSLSTGIALLAIYVRKLIDKGLSVDEIVKKTKERIPNVQASFVLDKLNYLHKGGRCSSLQLLGANILKIKPQILVENGKMRSAKKYIGFLSSAIKSYCDNVLEKFNNPDYEHVFITYSSAEQKDIDYLKEKLSKAGFKNIYVTTAGGTISSHCGPGCLGVLYINDGGK